MSGVCGADGCDFWERREAEKDIERRARSERAYRLLRVDIEAVAEAVRRWGPDPNVDPHFFGLRAFVHVPTGEVLHKPRTKVTTGQWERGKRLMIFWALNPKKP